MFFKILPISIYLGHRSLSLPQTWLLFQHGVLLLPTCLSGLESPQALCRIKLNAVLSLFWLELGQTKWPHCIMAPAKENASGTHGRGHWNYKLHQWRGSCTPFEPSLMGGTTPFKFPPYSLFRKGSRKTNFFSAIFQITSIWSASYC